MLRLVVDLNSERLSRLGEERDVRETAADNDDRAATFHYFRGWTSSDDTDTAGRIGAVIRKHILPEH